MGHSRLYGFDGRLMSGTTEYRVGVDSLKQAHGFLSENQEVVNGFKVDRVILWPQTASAKRMTAPADYIEVSRDGVKRKDVTEV